MRTNTKDAINSLLFFATLVILFFMFFSLMATTSYNQCVSKADADRSHLCRHWGSGE